MSTSASPPSSSNRSGLIVLAAGVSTSAAVMWLVGLLADSGFDPMGWYFYYLIPVGAMVVGVLSGAGYALAARKVNMTLSPGFVGSIVFISLIDYFANLYVSYSSLMERVHGSPDYSFFRYLRDICENMAFRREADGALGKSIGVFGYLFKGLEVAGFVAGSTIPAKLAVDSVASTPDCLKCRQYFVPLHFGYLNASEQWADLAEMSHVDRVLTLEQSNQPLINRTRELMDSLDGTSFATAHAAISKLEREAAMGNTATITFTLRKCPGCDAFHLLASFVGYDAHGVFFSHDIRSVGNSASSNGDAAPTPEAAS